MLRRGVGVFAACGGTYTLYKHQTDEGFRRALVLYGSIGPVVVHYRLVEAKQAWWPHESRAVASAEWRALDRRYAERVVRRLEELQGMYTKYGQIGAGMTNTFSNVWVEQLRKLEDAVPPRPTEVVMQTILEETGRPASELFSSFDEKPLGSASIGQVHRATLRRDGAEVAVKVQYPNASRLFRSDMATIRGFCKIFAPEQVVTLGELERQFEFEFDYRHEAHNLAEIAANMRKHGFMPREVVVPRPYLSLCSERMLVMELLPGCKLLDGLRKYVSVLAAKEGKSLEEFEEEKRLQIEREGMPARYSGPPAWKIQLYLSLMRWCDLARNLLVGLHNGLIGTLTGRRLEYFHTTAPPNAPRMMDVLMRVHGTQLLADGCFNADTHAGNFLLMPDDRIALIDYGSVKRLNRSERLSACVLYAALRRNDEEMLLNIAISGGYKSKYLNKKVITKLLKFGNDTMGRELLGDKNPAQFMDELKAEDPYEEIADNLVMASFMSFRLRIVGMALNHPVVCSDWWGEIAERELEREGLPYQVWTPELLREVNKGTLRIAKS